MDSHLRCICFSLFFFLLFIQLASSSYVSSYVFQIHGSNGIGRSLLQAQKGCPIDFENANYTVLTSMCKGPRYPQKQCCDAFKNFACPYANEINDLTTGCADNMFSYINLYGKYPPGLFANQCNNQKDGMNCDVDPPPASTKSGGHIAQNLSSLLTIALFTVLLFQMF